MNLLEETKSKLIECSKTPEDVIWVGVTGARLPNGWEDFVKISDFKYDNGYGGNEIHSDLVIVGKDWWLERGEYDGSEWWEFKTIPVIPTDEKVFDLRGGFNE